jgi:hypothetical protein
VSKYTYIQGCEKPNFEITEGETKSKNKILGVTVRYFDRVLKVF